MIFWKCVKVEDQGKEMLNQNFFYFGCPIKILQRIKNLIKIFLYESFFLMSYQNFLVCIILQRIKNVLKIILQRSDDPGFRRNVIYIFSSWWKLCISWQDIQDFAWSHRYVDGLVGYLENKSKNVYESVFKFFYTIWT